MNKSDLIELLKTYKENKAKLNIKLKELKVARIKLKSLEETRKHNNNIRGKSRHT